MTQDPRRGNRRVLDVAAAAQLACLLEASAPKPGNVSPGRHFDDLRYEDFLASAIAIGPAIADAARQPVGVTVRRAVDAVAACTRSNTSLGIVLLLAPLAAAVARGGDNLRAAVGTVLTSTTADDAREVYEAIRLASPGGLGRADSQDVDTAPTGTLLEVMRLAADRDGIAREYATGFSVTFEVALPALARARGDGLSWDEAVVETYLETLGAYPDTHIARRGGAELAADVSRGARRVLDEGGVRTESGRTALTDFDRSLRGPRHLANPGTTADLMAAAIFAHLLQHGWTAV